MTSRTAQVRVSLDSADALKGACSADATTVRILEADHKLIIIGAFSTRLPWAVMRLGGLEADGDDTDLDIIDVTRACVRRLILSC